jgi:hypothetical protein
MQVLLHQLDHADADRHDPRRRRGRAAPGPRACRSTWITSLRRRLDRRGDRAVFRCARARRRRRPAAPVGPSDGGPPRRTRCSGHRRTACSARRARLTRRELHRAAGRTRDPRTDVIKP